MEMIRGKRFGGRERVRGVRSEGEGIEEEDGPGGSRLQMCEAESSWSTKCCWQGHICSRAVELCCVKLKRRSIRSSFWNKFQVLQRLKPTQHTHMQMHLRCQNVIPSFFYLPLTICFLFLLFPFICLSSLSVSCLSFFLLSFFSFFAYFPSSTVFARLVSLRPAEHHVQAWQFDVPAWLLRHRPPSPSSSPLAPH